MKNLRETKIKQFFQICLKKISLVEKFPQFLIGENVLDYSISIAWVSPSGFAGGPEGKESASRSPKEISIFTEFQFLKQLLLSIWTLFPSRNTP